MTSSADGPGPAGAVPPRLGFGFGMRLGAARRKGDDSGRYRQADRDAPGAPENLTAEWATEAMRAAGVLCGGHRVVSASVGPLTGDGRPMTGELVRVALSYDPVGAGPGTAVAKFASRHRAMKGMIEQFDGYAREIHFYRDLASRMPVRVPRHLGSGVTPGRSKDSPAMARIVDVLPARVHVALATDPTRIMRATKRRYALLLEDCSDTTVVHNLVTPPSVELLAVALDTLAELHAAFWGGAPGLVADPSLRSALGHISTLTPRLFANELRLRSLGVARARWSDWWVTSDTVMALEAADRIVDDVAAINRPVTLVHGDPRSDNLLFLAGGGSPTIIDWAIQSVAHPGWDVSYLLSSSLNDTDAAEGLIAGYRQSLARRGAEIDEADLRTVIVAGWRVQAVMNILAVRVAPGDYGEAGAFYDLWVPRILALLRNR